MYGNTKLTDQFGKTGRPASLLLLNKSWLICVAPRALRVVRIKNENESVANVQRIMQGPAYQEKERRAATWNAAGCGSGLSESDLELVRSKSLPCGRKRKVAVSRTRNENGGSEQVPAVGGGKRGGGASQAERQR
jgi:hypothetical protein